MFAVWNFYGVKTRYDLVLCVLRGQSIVLKNYVMIIRFIVNLMEKMNGENVCLLQLFRES